MAKHNYRRMLGEELSNRLLAHFKKHGIGAIERVYRENPAEYLRVATRLIPHEIEAEVKHSFTAILEDAKARAEEKVINQEAHAKLPSLDTDQDSKLLNTIAKPASDHSIVDAEVIEKGKES
jgi:hypothetical protein